MTLFYVQKLIRPKIFLSELHILDLVYVHKLQLCDNVQTQFSEVSVTRYSVIFPR